MLACGINKRKWDGLSREHREILRSAARDTYHWSIGEFTWRNAEFLVILKREHSIEIRPFPDDVLTAAAKISRDIWAEAGSTDALGKRIYENWLAAFRQMRPWFEDVESRYVTLRAEHMARGA